MKIYGPAKAEDLESLNLRLCPMCEKPFVAGDKYVLVPIGPDADDDEAVRKHLSGKGFYNARARCVHLEPCLEEITPDLQPV